MPGTPEYDQLRPVHVVLIATAAPHATLAAIADGLCRIECQLRGLSLKPVGASFEAVLRLGGISEGDAERLATSIAAWPRAGSVRVEHLAPLP